MDMMWAHVCERGHFARLLALLYQTMDGVVLRAILRWTSEEDSANQDKMAERSRSMESNLHGPKDHLPTAIDLWMRQTLRVNCATTLWNISKVSGNITRLVSDRKTFLTVLRLAVQKNENPAVLRRILSCVQNLASERSMLSSMLDLQLSANRRNVTRQQSSQSNDETRTVADYSEEAFTVDDFKGVADFLKGLFEHVPGNDHVEVQVLATIASFAYAGATGSARSIVEELRSFLRMDGQVNSVHHFFQRNHVYDKVI